MKSFKSYFKLNKQERSGIFFLLFLIVLFQLIYFLVNSVHSNDIQESFLLDIETQKQIDVLKANALQKDSIVLYPFNPNFITDFKGYTLGMSVEEIDRLHSFRKGNKFVNSSHDFQKVTRISDSLLNAISPYFEFPEWTQKKKITSDSKIIENEKKGSVLTTPKGDEVILDLNQVSASDLRTINGIGEKLSERIIKFRDRLGGFMNDDQLSDVYGLESEIVQKTLKKFKVLKTPNIKKININTASANEISKLVYIQKHVAEGIVNYRNVNGTIVSFDELISIEDFPADKIDRIRLYLSL